MRMDIIYISIQSTDAASMRGPVESLCVEKGWDMRITCANDSDVDADPVLYHDIAGRARDADLVLVRCMSDPTRMRRFADLEKVLRESSGYVMVYSGNMEVLWKLSGATRSCSTTAGLASGAWRNWGWVKSGW